MKTKRIAIILIIYVMNTLFACQPTDEHLPTPFVDTNTEYTPTFETNAEPVIIVEQTETIVDEYNPSEGPFNICAPKAEELPRSIGSKLSEALKQNPLVMTDEACASLKVGNENKVGEMVLALVAPFPTIVDGISTDSLQSFWQNGTTDSFDRLLMYPYAKNALRWLWGEPVGQVDVFDYAFESWSEAQLEVMMKEAWTNRRTWAIVEFNELSPRWKVIALDEQNPVHKVFNATDYALTLPLSINHDDPQMQSALNYFFEEMGYINNRNQNKLATVILTGVTALARATAVGMDKRGVTVPGEDLAPVLQEADILHISNEVPFYEDCPKPTVEFHLNFCSSPSYIELLRSIGTDVVELTGDHFNDYGPEAMALTLEMYEKEGWPVYGGGKNVAAAREPLRMEVNGNKIAFLGCNAKPVNKVHATETQAGAFLCDMDYMEQTVKQLLQEGYLPIVTFQHEEFYTWEPIAWLTRDFEKVLEAGAVIVSGSQAHQPHYAEFLHGGFVHYGLGNLFFDQYGVYEYSHLSFIDRHVFYEGRHISTELLTIRFYDWVKPVWTTPEQRAEMLKMLFNTPRMNWKDTQ